MKRSFFAVAVLTLVIGGVFFSPPPAQAATINVDRFDDRFPDPGACTAAANDCTLREAVIAANSDSDNDTVQLQAGTYRLTREISFEANPDDETAGDIEILFGITVRGQGASSTVIRASGLFDRIFDVRGANVFNARFIDLRLQDGRESATGPSGNGGAIRSLNSNASTFLTRVTLVANSSTGTGGAISSVGPLSVVSSTFTDNHAQSVGDALVTLGVLSIVNSTFSFNGNGVDEVVRIFGGSSTITGSTFHHNAVAVLQTGGNLVVTNSTFSSNVRGIEVAGAGTQAEIRSVTILDSGIVGLTMGQDTDVILINSIVARSFILDCSQGFGSPPFSAGFNLDSDGSCKEKATDKTFADPQLGPLANNGGPTLTHVPLPGSPAIDTGVTTGCPATDQRGVTRPRNGDGLSSARCDKGAVERKSPAIP
ncbi:MAG: choice-of-anchor Q domain-containing protein [Dehalococcoidia bacterium]